MSLRLLIGLLVACILAFGIGMALWAFVQPTAETEVPATAPASDAERRERFLGGDPDRDVRGGQEMKPQW